MLEPRLYIWLWILEWPISRKSLCKIGNGFWFLGSHCDQILLQFCFSWSSALDLPAFLLIFDLHHSLVGGFNPFPKLWVNLENRIGWKITHVRYHQPTQIFKLPPSFGFVHMVLQIWCFTIIFPIKVAIYRYPLFSDKTLLFLPDPCPRAPKETQYCRARRFLCHICQCTQGFATPWGGVGWGGAVMTFLWTWSRCWCYATHWGGVGWGGAVMTFLWTWSRCWCYATHWGGVGWGSDDVPLDLITLVMLRHALGWGGVGWDSAACFSLLQKRKDESNRVRTEKNRRLEPGQRLAEGVTQKQNKRQMLY